MSYSCRAVPALVFLKNVLSFHKKIFLGFTHRGEGVLVCHFLESPSLQITRIIVMLGTKWRSRLLMIISIHNIVFLCIILVHMFEELM